MLYSNKRQLPKVPATIQFRKVFEVEDLPPTSVIASFTADEDGKRLAAVLWENVPPRNDDKPADWFRRIFTKRYPPQAPPSSQCALVRENGSTRKVSLAQFPLWLIELQRFGSHGWLTYEARSLPDDRNLKIYDNEFRETHSVRAGDGIKEVQTDSAGAIWVSYFDEGVFGGSEIASSGVVRFDAAGAVQFRYSELAQRHNLPLIDDCYAMNLVNGATWIYYYSAFPLVKIENDDVAAIWKDVGVNGARAFAVAEDEALFAGSYDDHYSVFRFSLSDSRIEKLSPVDESGQPLPRSNPISPTWFARGSRLYFRSSDTLFCCDSMDF